MIPIRFACGHRATVSPNAEGTPRCLCGETRIARVQARAPSFTGACTGPYATFRALEAVPINVAPKGALTLKAQE